MFATSDLRRALESVGLVPGLSSAEVQTRLEQGNHLLDTGQRLLAFYLVEMEEKRLYQDTGHSSTIHYAEARLQLDRRRVGELLAVGRKLLTVPRIDYAFCTREIGWSKVLLLVPIVVPEHEEKWLEVARKSSVRELAHVMKGVEPGDPPRRKGQRGILELRYRYGSEVGAGTHV